MSTKKAKGIKLDDKFLANVHFAIERVWQQIGNEIVDEVESNEGAIECCIDADRLLDINTAAHRAVHDAYMEHGFKVVKFLSKHIRLV